MTKLIDRRRGGDRRRQTERRLMADRRIHVDPLTYDAMAYDWAAHCEICAPQEKRMQGVRCAQHPYRPQP